MIKLVMTKPALALSAGLVAAATMGIVGCGPNHHTQPAKQPEAQTIAATPVSDDEFGQALVQVLANGNRSPARLALLAGVVRRQFARAAWRFDQGQPERGLDAVKGALYLVRAGELKLEMLDPSAAKALEGAHEAVAPRGLEGPTLAFLRLQASSLPETHPAQERIREHLAALSAWMQDTRQRSPVENTSANARAFGERAMLEPTPETLEEARVMVDRWMEASLEFNATFRPGLRNSSRDEMVEAYRALRTGAIIMAGLYLRHGDAAGAIEALERSEARKVTSPELFERLQTAASLDDPGAWRDLASLYSSASAEGGEEELAMPSEIAQGAMFGATVEAYRAEPTQLSAAGPLALLLATYGMPEGSPLVLTPVVKTSTKPQVLNTVLRVVAGVMLEEDRAHDYASVQRVFTASQELLAIADAVHQSTPLDPSPARIRSMMAALHVRSANLAAAKPMLERTLEQEPSLHGFTSLATVLLQMGDTQGALAAVQKGLTAPDAGEHPIGRAELHLLDFKIHRARGEADPARAALAAALQQALDARTVARNDLAHASADRVLSRLAYHYRDKQAWQRAVQRMLSRANVDPRVLSMALIEATATGLLYEDVRTGHKALEDTYGAANPEDVAYAALWVQLTELAAGDTSDGVVKDALSTVDPGSGWVYYLAQFGLGELDDAGLLAKASNVVERTEASFYIAMRKHARGDASARQQLRQIADGPAVDLVETHIAQEITQSAPEGGWGPPPKPLP